MTNRGLIALSASVFLMGPAFAQQAAPRVVGELAPTLSSAFQQAAQAQTLPQQTMVRVQSTISFFMAGPTNDSDEAQKLRDRARRQVYEAAARECDILRDTLAKDCRLESVNNNINVNRQYGQGQAEGFTINGNMTYQITLK